MGEPITDGYPVVLRLAGQRVLVVGGGTVAARKVAGLAAAGAVVTVVAPSVDAAIHAMPGVTIERRPYRAGDLAGHRLVIAATDEPAVQQQVFDDAKATGVWVNSADDPERCTFILPAVERRGPVIVAVSTQGTSPALAGHLRDLLAAALPANIESVAAELAEQRRTIQASGGSTEDHDWKEKIVEVFERFAG
ncbi:MAG: bifunctional precorrin-2 dehydrogenase/sirohydrochlorin ferrochelatase [Acidimicrobiia bacterium]